MNEWNAKQKPQQRPELVAVCSRHNSLSGWIWHNGLRDSRSSSRQTLVASNGYRHDGSTVRSKIGQANRQRIDMSFVQLYCFVWAIAVFLAVILQGVGII